MLNLFCVIPSLALYSFMISPSVTKAPPFHTPHLKSLSAKPQPSSGTFPDSLFKNPSDILGELSEKVKILRKSKKYSQEELANRSGVSLGSLKRFERSGQISLESLLKLIHILGRLEDFENVLLPKEDFQNIANLFSK